MEQEQGFIDYIEQSIIKNWDRNALTDYKGITLQYKDVARLHRKRAQQKRRAPTEFFSACRRKKHTRRFSRTLRQSGF